jgi:hypothetical protein
MDTEEGQGQTVAPVSAIVGAVYNRDPIREIAATLHRDRPAPRQSGLVKLSASAQYLNSQRRND